MQDDIDNIFRKIYRTFKRNNKKCDDIEILNSILNEQFGIGEFSVQSATITNSITNLHGFSVCYKEYKAFIPQYEVYRSNNTLIKAMGEILNEAEIILPNYVSFGIISHHCAQINIAPTREMKILAGERSLTSMFPPEVLSLLVIEHYTKFPVLEKCLVQIRETTETYCLGLYRSAITTLLPCIESTIRALGIRLGIDEPENVGTQFLLSIYDAWLKFYINDYVYRDYDWKPICISSKEFFSEFEERYQIALNGRNYIEKHLYQNTQNDTGISNLNRHSILHGFMTEYYTKGNYLRLINLLNNLCFMLTISGDPVSLFLPCDTVQSEAFLLNLAIFERTGMNRAIFLDKKNIER
ncbi:hypothetical protein ACX1HG_00440 [Yersinia enterocolitica]